ncbi:hypothetical protein GKZ89_08220 [Bacillus mangrovi]|uniref:Uncharacterized protein n=1 Tax=Metabacillus mangrovi TaxID=1491830 RepID=A0A7X2V4H6_9BACI|nr:hypothetical protein [Metabacillus mangrovi]
MRWKKEDQMFETLWEAEMWADSIVNEMHAQLYEGYETSDHKIAYVLAFYLSSGHDNRVIKTERFCKGDSRVYRVWMEKPGES